MNDENIIELFFQRSEDAILELSQKYGKLNLQIAYNITRDYEDAEECVDDAYMQVWNSIPPNRPENLYAYVTKVLRNISINKYKHNRRVKRNDTYFECAEELEDCIVSKNDIEIEYNTNEILKTVEEFIDSLKKVNRVIFLRRYMYMSSYEEIAELTGLNKTSVGNRLKRMRKNLKEILERKGLDYEW